MTNSKPLVESKALTVGYKSRNKVATVLAGLDLSILPGEFVCLLGPNGIGKSTLLRTLSAIQPPIKGSIYIHRRNIRSLKSSQLACSLSVVLTDRLDVDGLTSYNIVELGRYPHTGWRGHLSPQDHAIVRWAITAVGADHLASRNVNELSDGERQRILIGRALAQDPQVMLLDEPTAFLDIRSRVEITGLLRRLTRETSLAVIFSTHDLELALRTADTIWLLSPGGILTIGGPEDLMLDGSVSKAFWGETLSFNPHERSFHIHQDNTGTASVKGEGLTYTLARAAIERMGYRIVNYSEDPYTLRVEIREGDDVMWQAYHQEIRRQGENLTQLANFARSVAQ